VRGGGLEPPLLSEPDPKSGASTSSAILARNAPRILVGRGRSVTGVLNAGLAEAIRRHQPATAERTHAAALARAGLSLASTVLSTTVQLAVLAAVGVGPGRGHLILRSEGTMAMTLELDDAEVGALRGALEAYLPALAEEASRTDRIRDAHGLWERHRRLEAVQQRLRAGEAGSAVSWSPPSER
jgi:hypothetical protein